MNRVFITAARRSPVGAFGGTLKDTPPAELGAVVVKALLESHGEQIHVDELIAGNVLAAGHGMNIARQIALKAGLPESVPAFTINKVCGSALKAICLGASAITLGDADTIIAGGVESMSQAGFVNLTQRWGQKMGNVQSVDLMIQDGLTDAFHGCHMGITAENLAEKFSISREEQDQFAATSQQKAGAARSTGMFKDEIVPVPLYKRGYQSGEFSEDEYIRPETTLATLSALRPAFKKEGTVTAGNSSGINDGSAFVMLMSEAALNRSGAKPVAEVTGWNSAAIAPEIMGLGPVAAVKGLLQKKSMSLEDFDAIESNEAFAVQTLAVNHELKWNADKINTRGGAIALGHPIGASGARILVTLLHRLLSGEGEQGLATLCVGGGQGVAFSVRLL